MPTPVAATARARLQIAVIVDWLNEGSPATARHFQERLRTAYRQLSEFPLSGARDKTPNTRRLVLAPYVLTYRIVASGVEVLDIRHGRQRETPRPDDAP